MDRLWSLARITVLSSLVTGFGGVIAYWLELTLLEVTGTTTTWTLTVGFVEEAFVRFLPLIATFYLWSYRQGHLLSKTEGLLATVASGVTVAGLELVLKLDYLSRFEAVVQFDSLLLPILFVHLPFALVAGRFAYALGERIHGTDTIGLPALTRRTALALVVGYVVLSLAHVGYNLLV